MFSGKILEPGKSTKHMGLKLKVTAVLARQCVPSDHGDNSSNGNFLIC